VPFFYVVLLLVRYLTQRIVGLFNTPLRFLPTVNPTRSRTPRPERTTREESEQN
jgi:hypothetical protein